MGEVQGRKEVGERAGSYAAPHGFLDDEMSLHAELQVLAIWCTSVRVVSRDVCEEDDPHA